MTDPLLPDHEAERLAELKQYQILDTEPEEAFDDITSLAAAICEAPVAQIILIDSGRQWVKSSHGTEALGMPENFAFSLYTCSHPDEILMISDLRKDERFAGYSKTAGNLPVIFYAGVPLVNPQGFVLGVLCVTDQKPRVLKETQIRSVQMLAKQTVQALELRKANLRLHILKEEVKERIAGLEQFAYVVSHDIKSPLASIVLTGEMLRENFGDTINEENDQLLKVLNRASFKIRDLVDGMVSYYRGEKAMDEQTETFDRDADNPKPVPE